MYEVRGISLRWPIFQILRLFSLESLIVVLITFSTAFTIFSSVRSFIAFKVTE